MKKLSDILGNSSAEKLRQQWNQTESAVEYQPLPGSEYITHLISAELITGRTNGTPGYRLTFRVLEGPYAARLIWHEIWLTPAALPMAKRDLNKLGVTDLDQLERPLPPGIRCRVKLALQRDDNGNEFNKVRRFDVISIDTPEPDAFAPTDAAALGKGGGDES